jgi:transposase-like protein
MARQSYSKEFKARVALDTLKGQKTVSEIASEYSIHPNQVSPWKKKALEGMAESFARSKGNRWKALRVSVIGYTKKLASSRLRWTG